jgi:hypothetical protein
MVDTRLWLSFGRSIMYRKYIRIVEAANKGCPIATYDIDVKNRQKAIDAYHYGPANPDEPESYWKAAARSVLPVLVLL